MPTGPTRLSPYPMAGMNGTLQNVDSNIALGHNYRNLVVDNPSGGPGGPRGPGGPGGPGSAGGAASPGGPLGPVGTPLYGGSALGDRKGGSLVGGGDRGGGTGPPCVEETSGLGGWGTGTAAMCMNVCQLNSHVGSGRTAPGTAGQIGLPIEACIPCLNAEF